VEALILTKEVFKTECRSMDAKIANIDGEMKRESPDITIFGAILYFTNRRYEKYAPSEVWTRKVFTNI